LRKLKLVSEVSTSDYARKFSSAIKVNWKRAMEIVAEAKLKLRNLIKFKIIEMRKTHSNSVMSVVNFDEETSRNLDEKFFFLFMLDEAAIQGRMRFFSSPRLSQTN
jgi:hypothetical protein